MTGTRVSKLSDEMLSRRSNGDEGDTVRRSLSVASVLQSMHGDGQVEDDSRGSAVVLLIFSKAGDEWEEWQTETAFGMHSGVLTSSTAVLKVSENAIE